MENFKISLTKESLKPVLEKIEAKLSQKFPKEKREEIKELVLANLKETKTKVEERARTLAEKSKDSHLVLNYLRPLVESSKTTNVLSNIESRVSSAGPVVQKIKNLRQQFLDLTNPNSTEGRTDDVPTPKRKRKSKSDKSE